MGQVAIMVVLLLSMLTLAVSEIGLAVPGCPEKCGNISIPYPFGIGEGCFLNANFSLTCNKSSSTAMHANMEVLNVSVPDGTIRLSVFKSYDCYNRSALRTDSVKAELYTKAFTISSTENKFVAIGCDTKGVMTGLQDRHPYSMGCLTYCFNLGDVINGSCSGIGCCEITVPSGVNNLTLELSSFSNHAYSYSYNPCSSAMVIANDAFLFTTANLSTTLDEYREFDKAPMVFNWAIGEDNCAKAKENGSCLCLGNTKCVDPDDRVGYLCKCLPGFEGNPYLEGGCQDLDECASPNLNPCEERAKCINLVGSYMCRCPPWYTGGKGTSQNPCIFKVSTAIEVAIGIIAGSTILIVAGFWLYVQRKKKDLMNLRKTFFQQNGGAILDGSVHKVNVVSAEDLEKATNNYSEDNVIGKGGFGKVYKGVLDGQVVAIKKSLRIDSSQTEQFINEVIVLSEINNRNVVKLFGCCLETEVPLLVYEFIKNGTLYEHLHNKEKAPFLTWDIRLRIAAEVAGVLAYLHTTVSIPIFHRDMKSMNILLEEDYTAKVSDFGASKLVPVDHDLFATMIIGTRGYFDPECMQTGQLTDKSDVYSFGVVLVELLTRKEVFSVDAPESEKVLASHFLHMLREDRLDEILDQCIVSEENMEQIKEVAYVARSCLRIKGEERPSMKEVEIKLAGIRTESHQWSKSDAMDIHAETEHLLAGILDDNGDWCSSSNSRSMHNSQSLHFQSFSVESHGR